MELKRLCDKLGVNQQDVHPDEAAKMLAQALNGPTIVEKGKVDRITNGK
jgi:ATP-dependent NAD(P)H-hydrate dehydratase